LRKWQEGCAGFLSGASGLVQKQAASEEKKDAARPTWQIFSILF